MDYVTYNVLYDNAAYIVIHAEFSVPERQVREVGFELVDKAANAVVFLHNEEAAAFKARITEWQANTPQAEEVDETILSFMLLSQQPLTFH